MNRVAVGKQITDLSRGEANYPSRLEMLPDPPAVLHVRGTIPNGIMVAIVGSRKADPKSERFAGNLARDLVNRGVIVISGGALGIDTASHRGALDAGGHTVAVIGSGFDHVYPARNTDLFAEISNHGAVISQFEPAVPPAKWTFPKRNSLVAAMAGAVVVVQAAERSGALITARIARELGVPVGAVPGAPGEIGSRGCNGLIRGGAAMVEGVADVLRLLEGDSLKEQLDLPEMKSRGMETPSKAPTGLSEDEILVLDRLSSDPVHIDDIVSGTGLAVPRTGAALLNLELSGLVEDRGGKCFIRLR